MGLSYEQAVTALYQASFESFVTERKRLAGELKTDGDKSGAAQLAKLGRPSISAWAVNQLWWHARETFDELFETAAELRRGKHSASAAHRKALAKLSARAQQLLSESGHSANDATLRRVTMTLSGLAAAGNFEPDTPGALSKDRDPPGFEAFGIASASAEPDEEAPAEPKPQGEVAAPERKRTAEIEAAERKRALEAEAAERKRAAEAAAAERKREAEAEAKRQARRKKLEADLRDAKAELSEREHERDRVQKQLATAEREVERARADVDAAQAALEAE
ncbi:MAG TPA: hypothetical protein VER96_37650 [Polyangiaceae bacterium]|nr:hypothetical protein [Polyangiaceae bacterium]